MSRLKVVVCNDGMIVAQSTMLRNDLLERDREGSSDISCRGHRKSTIDVLLLKHLDQYALQ